MSVDRSTKFNDKQQSHLNKIDESNSENYLESMIFSKSYNSENIKIINIDSDERNNLTTLKILKRKLRM